MKGKDTFFAGESSVAFLTTLRRATRLGQPEPDGPDSRTQVEKAADVAVSMDRCHGTLCRSFRTSFGVDNTEVVAPIFQMKKLRLGVGCNDSSRAMPRK